MLAIAAASAANIKAIKAFQAGTLGFGLSGGGFLVYYLVGVVDALIKLGVIIPGQSKIAGASAGAIVTTAVCSGLNGEQVKQRAFALSDMCQVPGNCGGVLDTKVRQVLDSFAVKDAYKKCNNTGYLSITTGDLLDRKNLLVGTYASNEDLKNAAAASSYVPFFSGANLTTTFRGQTAADGGITNNLPCPPKVSHCLKFSLEPYGFKSATTDEAISILMTAQLDDGSNRFDPKLPPIPGKPTSDDKRIAAAAASGITIQPNVYHPLPFTRDQWQGMTFIPASDGTLQYLVDLGYADAMAWARRSGMAGAAAAAQAQRPKPKATPPKTAKPVGPQQPAPGKRPGQGQG